MAKELRIRALVFWQNIIFGLLTIGFWLVNWYFAVFKPIPGLHPQHMQLITPPLAMALAWTLLTLCIRTFWLNHAVMFKCMLFYASQIVWFVVAEMKYPRSTPEFVLGGFVITMMLLSALWTLLSGNYKNWSAYEYVE